MVASGGVLIEVAAGCVVAWIKGVAQGAGKLGNVEGVGGLGVSSDGDSSVVVNLGFGGLGKRWAMAPR